MIEVTLKPDASSCNSCQGRSAKYVVKVGDKHGSLAIRLCPECFDKRKRAVGDGLYPVSIE